MMTHAAGYRRLVQRAGLILAALVLAACQYLQPRSVDDIEKGRLPAPIEREDSTRSGAPVTPPDSGADSTIGSGVDAEQARIAAQRDSAAQDGVAVFSVGAAKSVGFREGASLSLQFVAEGSREQGVIAIDLSCTMAGCAERSVDVAGEQTVTLNTVTVLALTPGSWRLSAVQLNDVSDRADGEKTTVQLARPPRFDVRAGHATYLGAFTVIDGAQRTRNASGIETVRLPIVRHADLEDDMTRALADFPEARGRRMLNATRGLNTPQTLR